MTIKRFFVLAWLLLVQPVSADEVLRDRIWLWGHVAGSHNVGWNLPGSSRITPRQAADQLGIRNLIMVSYLGRPRPPFDNAIEPLRTMDSLVWSIVGAGGSTRDADRRAVLDLARNTPNIRGVMMDDFFRLRPAKTPDAPLAALSLDELRTVRQQLRLPDRQLELWVVVYDHQLGLPLDPYLDECDVVTFWTWRAEHLVNLEGNLQQIRRRTPGKKLLIGCYLWDYGARAAMPLDAHRKQCELASQRVRDGRADGIIFLASCICDLPLPTIDWTKKWIEQVGDDRLEIVAEHQPQPLNEESP